MSISIEKEQLNKNIEHISEKTGFNDIIKLNCQYQQLYESIENDNKNLKNMIEEQANQLSFFDSMCEKWNERVNSLKLDIRTINKAHKSQVEELNQQISKMKQENEQLNQSNQELSIQLDQSKRQMDSIMTNSQFDESIKKKLSTEEMNSLILSVQANLEQSKGIFLFLHKYKNS